MLGVKNEDPFNTVTNKFDAIMEQLEDVPFDNLNIESDQMKEQYKTKIINELTNSLLTIKAFRSKHGNEQQKAEIREFEEANYIIEDDGEEVKMDPEHEKRLNDFNRFKANAS